MRRRASQSLPQRSPDSRSTPDDDHHANSRNIVLKSSAAGLTACSRLSPPYHHEGGPTRAMSAPVHAQSRTLPSASRHR